MSNGIYLTLEQYKDKDLPITITINGHTYHSQFALATTQTTWFEMGKQHGMELGSDNTYSDNEMSSMHDAWFDEGYTKGYEAGYDAGIDHGIEKTLQDDRVKEELERTKQTWYAKGKEEGYGDGYEDGKKEATLEKVDQFNKGYEIGKYEGYEAGKKSKGYSSDDIKQLHTYAKGKEEGYDAGYNDGYEQCKHDGISKINLNTESVEQTELSKEYDKGFTKGYEEGYEQGKKNPECGIPGEYLSRIEEARLMGYEQGRSDCIEATLQKKLLQEHIMKYGMDDEDGVIMDSGDDEEDDELIGPEQTEYANGYAEGKAAGYEEGYERGFMDLRFLIKK